MLYLKKIPLDSSLLKTLRLADSRIGALKHTMFFSSKESRLLRYEKRLYKGKTPRDNSYLGYAIPGARLLQQIYGPEARYAPIHALPESYLEGLKAFEVALTVINDGIFAIHNSVPFLSCDVFSYRITYDVNGYPRTIPLFRGSVLQFRSNRQTEEPVTIESKSILNLPSSRKVETESIEFDRRFKVTSSSPEEALYVLAPKVILQWLELQRTLDAKIWAQYESDTLTLAIPGTNVRILGKSLFGSYDKKLEQIARCMRVPRLIVDTLRLDIPLTEGTLPDSNTWFESRKQISCEPYTIWIG